MGIYADFLANTKGMDITDPIVAGDRTVNEWVSEQIANGDVAEAAAYAAKDEVQSLSANDHTGGTFTLAFTLRSGETFTTAGIAVGATAGTIETAIDVAATSASVVGWTNGDISVSGGPADTAAVVFTFDGTSVTGQNHGLIVNDGTLLTGGTDDGTVTVTTNGQTKRTSWAILAAVGAITAGMPAQGADVTQYDLTAGPRDSNPALPSAAVLTTLAEEAGIEDLNANVVTAIKSALRLV
jgi:hypothetical protein